MSEKPKSMMEQVTGAFMFPWPRKPLGKPDGKGPGKPGQKSGVSKGSKGQKSGKPRSGIKHKKGNFGTWM